MRQCSIKSDFSSYGIFIMVCNSGALIDFTPTRCCSGDVEKGTDQLRLPCVAMSNDSEVADRFSRIDFHNLDSFQTSEFGEGYASALLQRFRGLAGCAP